MSTASDTVQPTIASPPPRDRLVAMWLWSIAGLVFAMIVVGGATRLTDSGLSITEWRPLLGVIPPLTEAHWLEAFEKYKAIPEYRLVNEGMSLDAFKVIYWWEWSHRFLGRLIGVAFALPFAAFWSMGRLRRGLPVKLAGVLALGAVQGAIGWYMVASGLEARIDVSQYRLALHLTTAFAILGLLVWLARDESVAPATSAEAAPSAYRWLAGGIVVLVMLQVMLGAFVAGLKAGLVYNTWPDMNGAFVPSDYWTTPTHLSFFESPAAAQFNHRMTAYIVVIAALATAIWAWRSTFDNRIRASALLIAVATTLQMAVGVLTLLAHVPLSLGLLHQGGGALVLAIAVWHLHATMNVGMPHRA